MPSGVRASLSMSFVLVTLAGLAACSSKNPDALNAANVEENYGVSESNFAENVDAAAANAPAPSIAEPPSNEAENSSKANIDAAVNLFRQADEDQNEYCDAQKEATGESDCDD